MTVVVDQVSKVTASHLARDAYVYVRQSTLTQVREHSRHPGEHAVPVLDAVVLREHHVVCRSFGWLFVRADDGGNVRVHHRHGPGDSV